MSTLMHKPTNATLEGQAANLRRASTPTPAFKPEFRRSVRMHPLLAGAVAAVVLLLMLAVALRQKPSYYAESLVYIEPFSSNVLPDGSSSAFDSTKYESSLAQQMLTAQRVDILATALSTLPHQVWAVYGATPKTAASVLQNQLKVMRVSTSYQISISLKGPDAANTAAIVNAVTAAYLEAGRKDEISQADQRSQLLSEERSRIEEELTRTRAEQTQLGTVLGVASPGVEGAANPFDSKLDALRSQLVQAQANHDQAAAQLEAISGGGNASGLKAAANDVINTDPGLGSMKATINQRRAQLSSQMAGLTPGNPIYKQDQDELADLEKTLDTMTVQLRDRAARSLQDKLRTDLERSSDVEARVNEELARQTASATSASPRLQRAAELAADVQRLNARYTTVDNALHSLELQTTGPGMAHLALAASVPTGPEPTRKRLILLAALPLALMFGLGAAVFARKRDRRVYTGADVDEVLGFAPIAILPARSEVSEDVLDEYFLRLAAGVEGAYRGGNARTFVITAVSAETNIEPLVRALDRKLAELGLGVAILQAETVFDQPVAPAAETSELGPAYDRHFEGLAATLFDRMKAEHDVILLEAPALLISAQTEYVARCSDVTLLVAESAVTTRGELYQAGALLQRLNVTGVGSVLEELQLRYADAAFTKGVRVLERRGRSMRKQQPTAQPVVHPPAEEPIAGAPGRVEQRYEEAKTPEAAVDSLEITSSPAEPAWYPDHADAAPEAAQAPPLERRTEPVAAAPEVAVEAAAPIVDPVEVEAKAPMALFDSHEFAPERRRSKLSDEHEDAPPARSWFKRIFQREPEPVFSILPDDDGDEIEAPTFAATAAYDASRYDLPLPVEQAPAYAAPQSGPLAESFQAEPTSLVHTPAPVAQVVDTPLPEPEAFGPVVPAPTATVHSAPEPVATRPAILEPVVPAPAAAEPAIYAFSPRAVAGFAAANAAPATQEPARALPSRPLSFLELSQLREPSAPAALPPQQHFEPAVEPEPDSPPEFTAPTLTQTFEAAEPEPLLPEPAAYTEPVVAADDWNPTPLNRWDPIPPLRPQEEPWRISGSMRIAQQSTRGVWGDEEPVHIPPTDRWAAPEAIAADAPPAESSDLVLTRRWGLLSRFQQGESFQSSRSAKVRQADPQDTPAQDFGQDYESEPRPDYSPEYDRRRR